MERDILEAALFQSDTMDILESVLASPTINVTSDTPCRHFRTAKEIQTDGHGNYINGKIEIDPPPKAGEVKYLQKPRFQAQISTIAIRPYLLKVRRFTG